MNGEELLKEFAALKAEMEELRDEIGERPRPGAEMLTLRQAARFLGVTPGTLRKWVQAHRVTHYRFPRPTSRPTFRRRDLENLMAAGKVEPRRAGIARQKAAR